MAQPAPHFDGYTVAIFNKAGTATHRATGHRAALARMGGPVGVAMVDAGVRAAPPDPGRTRATRHGDPFQAARDFQEDGGSSVLALLRQHGHVGTKKHAALVVYGPAPADGGWNAPGAENGMPYEEAMRYWQDPLAPMRRHIAKAAYGALVPAYATAGYPNVPLGQLPPHFRVRCDIMFMTRDADGEDGGREKGYFGAEILRTPYMFRGTQCTCHSLQSLNLAIAAFLQEFGNFLASDLEERSSNQVFDSLVATYVWAFPTNDAAAGGALYGMPTPALDEETGLPRILVASHGVIPNWPVKKDTACIARAVMTGLHPLHDANSGSNLLAILKDALKGAQTLADYYTKLTLARKTEPPAAPPRGSTHALALARVTELQALLDRGRALLTSQGRLERLPGDGAHKYRSRTHFVAIEQALGRAMDGIHSLIDFRDPAWKAPARADAALLSRLEAAARKPDTLAFNFWTLSCHSKIAFLMGSSYATLAFLQKGGRILNLLFADNHCVCIRSVSACCNHMEINAKADAGDTRTRVGVGSFRMLCELCGHGVSKSNAASRWNIFLHQQRGCTRLPGVLFSPYGSRGSRRQLQLNQYSALVPSLCLAACDTALDTEEHGFGFSFAVKVSSSWSFADPCDPDWLAFRRRYSYAHSACYDVVEKAAPLSRAPFRFLSAAEFLNWLASIPVTEGILGATHYVGPRDAAQLAALGDVPGYHHMCAGCQHPVLGLCLWDSQDAAAALSPADVDLDDDEDDRLVGRTDDDADDAADQGYEDVCELPDDVTRDEPTRAPYVLHHCHATGAVAWAHGRCNDAMRQSTNTLTIEVGSHKAMAELVHHAFSEAFIMGPLKGSPPRISEVDGVVNRLILKVQSSDRGLHEAEKTRFMLKGLEAASTRRVRWLTLVFRPATAVLPALVETPVRAGPATTRAVCIVQTLAATAEKAFKEFGLWLPAFATQISFARGILYRLIPVRVVHGVGLYAPPTSLCSSSQLRDAKRLLLGGRIVVGEQVQMPLLTSTLSQRLAGLQTHRFLLDFTASYPAQMLKWDLPCDEGLDREVPFFPDVPLADRVRELLERDLDAGYVERVEISGAFPPELHERLGQLAPVWSRIDVKGSMLSAFQRTYCYKDPTDSLGSHPVGHFFPLENHVVFVREAQILLRLGFCCTAIRTFWQTPSSGWAEPFARKMQALRRSAKATGDAQGEELYKFLSNAVIGSLAVDPGKYTSLFAVKTFCAGEEEAKPGYMTRRDRILDDPRFTLRVVSAGDCTLYEMNRRSWKHTAHSLAFAFIQAMARCDLLELFYIDLQPHFGVTVGYGCTDSLAVELTCKDARPCKYPASAPRDVRLELDLILEGRWDLSNIPRTSSFWALYKTVYGAEAAETRMREAAEFAGVWGHVKDEAAGAGLAELVVNGPNRWAYRVDLSVPVDCAPKHRAAGGAHTLKALPKAWVGKYTVDDFAASWRGEDLPAVAPLEPLTRMFCGDALAPDGEMVKKEQTRRAVSLWANTACLVQRSTGKHVVLGSQTAVAEALRSGALW